MLTKKRNNRYKEKTSHGSVAYSSGYLRQLQGIPGGLSNDNRVGYTYTEHSEQHERTAPGGYISPERISGELLCPE